MGNCCTKMCGQQSPCHLAEDETKGLLHSSESKTSTKAGTETCTSPVSDEDKWQQETKPALDTAITKQPTAESEILKAQSSYSKTIPILHTEQSLTSKVDHLISLETTPTTAAGLAMETDVQKIEVQDIQNFASEEPQDEVEVPEDGASQVKRETERQHGSPEGVAPVTIDEAGVSSTSQDLTFAPVKEAPAEEMPVKEAPAEEMTVKEEPAEEMPVKEELAEEMPVQEAPVEEMPVKVAPVEEMPVKVAPVDEMPIKVAPVEEMPVKVAPVEEMPVKVAPVEEMPVKVAPVEEMPVKEAPVEEMPVKVAPVEEMPVKVAPVEEMPVKVAPVEEMPVKEAPVEEMPVKEAPVEEMPVKEAPVEEMPVKETPAEKMLVEEAPADEMPVKEAPVEEMPVKEAPAEEVFEAPMFAWIEAEINLPEVKPETHVSGKGKMLQIGELTPNVTTEVKQEVSLIPDTGEIAVIDNSSTEPDSRMSGQLNHHLDATEESVPEVTCEESTPEKLQQEASETQEYSKEVSSPVVDITNGLSPGVENGLTKDSNNLSTENKTQVDVTVVEECQKDDAGLKPSEEVLDIANEELSSKSSTNTHSAVQVDTPEVINSLTNQEENKDIAHQEKEGTQNGLNSISASAASSPTEKTTPFEPTSDAVAVETTEVEGEVTALKEEKSLEPQDDAEPEPQQRKEEIENQEEVTKEQKEEYQKQGDEIQTQEEDKPKEESDVTPKNAGPVNSKTQKGGVIFSSGKVEVQLLPVPSLGSVEEVQKLDESADLYLGAEEIEKGASKEKPSSTPVLEFTIPGVESRSSLAPAVDILAYSEREWKGNTTKSALIRKGYSEMARSFSGLKQVRGDNYCALRATLYQVLANSTNTPAWLQDEGFLSLPETIEAQEHLIGGWAFPPECTWGSEKDSVERMIYYLDLFKTKWQAAAACESPEERQSLCDRVFQGGEEEYGLLEALKFLMLAKAIELHGNMVADQEVPVFCWLLFARDTSENPKTLLANHLSQIGFSGGVEQVEMFLLGYALQHTIQAFRLYMTDTVEFVTHYPDDHKHEWPCVCIVTEDDRHYNVPVRTAQHQQGNNITVT
nr:fibrous sheath CABYR-binding protein [Misgurnus anguillicaudatus]XP_055037900.1 fibrous sheath CABYR-binding protein [Misgurnus anguillicaudatus]